LRKVIEPGVTITNSKENPQTYRCARWERCGYSASHDEGYGGFYRHGHRALCSECLDFVRKVEESLLYG
jgi:hypothetical protein